MRYIARKILSFIIPLTIICVCAHGVKYGFIPAHYYFVGGLAVFMSLMYFAKIIRRIIFFPINLLRKVLFRI